MTAVYPPHKKKRRRKRKSELSRNRSNFSDLLDSINEAQCELHVLGWELLSC